jgi:hypothetical protein
MQFTEEAAKELAKTIALRCFRNTELENLYSGKMPHTEAGDYSDVKVVTPSGEIPWSELSRISDLEMKVLMMDVVDRTFSFWMKMSDEAFLDKSLEQSQPFTKNWKEPELIDTF